jgi:WD40 repeat protein
MCVFDNNAHSWGRGSISHVQCGENNIAVSASYDKTLKIWDLDKPSCIHTLRNKSGHMKAITTFMWENSLVVSGGRDGMLCIWVKMF